MLTYATHRESALATRNIGNQTQLDPHWHWLTKLQTPASKRTNYLNEQLRESQQKANMKGALDQCYTWRPVCSSWEPLSLWKQLYNGPLRSWKCWDNNDFIRVISDWARFEFTAWLLCCEEFRCMHTYLEQVRAHTPAHPPSDNVFRETIKGSHRV